MFPLSLYYLYLIKHWLLTKDDSVWRSCIYKRLLVSSCPPKQWLKSHQCYVTSVLYQVNWTWFVSLDNWMLVLRSDFKLFCHLIFQLQPGLFHVRLYYRFTSCFIFQFSWHCVMFVLFYSIFTLFTVCLLMYNFRNIKLFWLKYFLQPRCILQL